MPLQAPTAVLDTNVLLDWLLFADPAAQALGQAVQAGQLQWLGCPAMQAEWRHVLTRPMQSRWDFRREQLLTFDITSLQLSLPDPQLGAALRLVCRDPDDQKFIDLALQAGAQWLLSRDKALLCLARKAAPRGLRVATPAQWAAAQVP